ncbi:hypothetical protein EYF80_000827 [Liparis tanakae]|uniref:Uncharacterized protein n=1 Tax=Liparis tanakae TaxID=230148 RepID=A0A4Z2JFB7_9TELE|nr:hypothetical protein EYF80_000827 [Liparis tanakae]
MSSLYQHLKRSSCGQFGNGPQQASRWSESAARPSHSQKSDTPFNCCLALRVEEARGSFERPRTGGYY